MSRSLPERPDWGQLKKQAKDLLRDVRANLPDALARLAAVGESAVATFSLHDAQRVLAREYGWPSWPRLKIFVETRGAAVALDALIHAALRADTARVTTILEEHPGLARESIHVAAVLGDVTAISKHVEQDAARAVAPGGPRSWEPILYLAFGRVGGDDAPRAQAARILLEHGANPNASYIEPEWPEAAQTALYGATGVNNRPVLATVLLEAGADPNDGESRYHAAEHNHRDCLEVLWRHGANFEPHPRWGNTPLWFLLSWYNPAPAVREGIAWLLERGANPNVVCHGQTALHCAIVNGWEQTMIETLLLHQADSNAPGKRGTPYAAAVRAGREDIVALLRTHGAHDEATPTDRLLGACMRAGVDEARALLRQHPGLLASLEKDERQLPHHAARAGRAAALELMEKLGFDLNVVSDEGERPLHWAAWHGQAAAVKVLISAGVEIDACDPHFHAPPIGWCHHGSTNCRNPSGDYAAVMEALIQAGATVPANDDASPEVVAVMKRYRRSVTK